jgi:hypothetical protein
MLVASAEQDCASTRPTSVFCGIGAPLASTSTHTSSPLKGNPGTAGTGPLPALARHCIEPCLGRVTLKSTIRHGTVASA